MERQASNRVAAYVGLLIAAFALAFALDVKFGAAANRDAYDFMFRAYEPRPWATQSVILAIDERTLAANGGLAGIREPLARALRLVAAASPKAVAVDVILADRKTSGIDRDLADALRATPNLVLSSEITDDGWEDPLPEFREGAAAIGHVHALPDTDGVTRSVPLEKRIGTIRRWAISLQAFALSRGAALIESPVDLRVGATVIPVAGMVGRSARTSYQSDERRLMRVRFVPPDMRPIPRVSMQALLERPALASQFTGEVVFAGVTVQTEHDRLLTPYSEGRPASGIEIHANAFETMAQGLFITDVPDVWVMLFSLGLVAAAGLAFRYLPGWWAYAGAAAIIMIAHATPYVFFTHQRVFPFAMPAAAAWLGTMTAAGFYHLVVRRDWRDEKATRTRYQQAMHFVTHEMRTPLSAIQGSSELISRYPLTEDKRKQIAQLINSESKRLARMVEVFLNVEKLSAGQMELKRENVSVKEMIEICVERVRPLAERKHIAISLAAIAEELRLKGDRELLEYACYNLLTNAVKYSPQRTEVMVSAWNQDHQIRISVQDQGIGMDQKEAKQVFQKFYRTRKAEESGEAGTGIGLSIVQQIVEQHGGRIELTSQPGAGSCFTLVMPAAAAAPVSTVVERH